jgi:hypothetical protein
VFGELSSPAAPAQCTSAVKQRCGAAYHGCDCSTVDGCLACAFEGFRDLSDPQIAASCTASEVPHQDIEAACGMRLLAKPSGVRCVLLNASAVAVEWNSSSSSSSSSSVAVAADMVAVELSTAPQAKPFLSHTAEAGARAARSIRIAQLPPLAAAAQQSGDGAAATYFATVRAHSATSPTLQAGWSLPSVPVACSSSSGGGGGGDGGGALAATAVAAAAAAAGRPLRSPPASSPSAFVAVYRWSEGTRAVDWLENHDAGDQGGQAAYVTTSSLYNDSEVAPGSWEALWPNSTLSEYCVEVPSADARLPPGRAFADYRSCNVELGDASLPSEAPACQCAIIADRLIAHNQGRADRELLNASCPGVVVDGDEHHGGSNCTCSESSLALSATFAGRQPVLFPWFKDSRYVNPDDDPARGAGVKPWGFWYHFPRGGRCAEGQQLGDSGCAWKRHPRTRVISPADIYAQGMNRSFQPDVGRGQNMGFEQVLHNGRAMVAAFDRVSGPSCCSAECLHVR